MEEELEQEEVEEDGGKDKDGELAEIEMPPPGSVRINGWVLVAVLVAGFSLFVAVVSHI